MEGTKDESVENDVPYWSSGPVGSASVPFVSVPSGGRRRADLHTSGHADLAGCALSIAYASNARDVRPEDFVVFSVQHECVWHRDTVFDVPADMPPCPNGKCMYAAFASGCASG